MRLVEEKHYDVNFPLPSSGLTLFLVRPTFFTRLYTANDCVTRLVTCHQETSLSLVIEGNNPDNNESNMTLLYGWLLVHVSNTNNATD